MPDTIEDEIKAFEAGYRDIAREDLGDGSSKLLRAYVHGPRYTLWHCKGEVTTSIFETTFPDEAAGAYRAFEAADTLLHPAYLPRGVSWPEKSKIQFPVYAVGSTVTDCVRGFLSRTGDTLKNESMHDLSVAAGKLHEWAVGFVSEESGTAFKAAGSAVPGGYVMTWWA